MTDAQTIRWESGADGIVVLTLDDPEQSANTMNARYRASMDVILDRLESEKESLSPRRRRRSSPAAIWAS
jgi:3-hydroxyacyl-CoA dehydrogenase/enoyl-CoA hydratase/3-hydroxybutyryl-CoA epimerase